MGLSFRGAVFAPRNPSADVIFGPDGAMYISDDKGGRAYRVVYIGQ